VPSELESMHKTHEFGWSMHQGLGEVQHDIEIEMAVA
jgi:hypothetical protein